MYLNDQMLDSGALRTRLMSQATNGVAYWDESVGRRLFVWDTINSRWQMVYGDTGWRDVSASILNSWTGIRLRLRRVGMTVSLSGFGIVGSSASSDTFYDLPTGFKPIDTVYPSATPSSVVSAGLLAVGVATTTSVANGTPARASWAAGRFEASWLTTDAWPTSLPGTASGSIPNA